jgi:Fe-coproporphyrin III synthase
MISISRLMCNNVGPGDKLRYANTIHTINGAGKLQPGVPRPVVVWNCTRRCNLSCLHCYASASNEVSKEMDTLQGKTFIGELADFGVPVILFSGGEPLMRKDLFELAEYASKGKIRVSLSTNGTLITSGAAGRMKDIGFAEVGISLDGVGQVNDKFRGKTGAFGQAVKGIKHCISHGLRVSLRLTITDYNYGEIPAIFKLAEDEGIQRICFYHLAYSGRGKGLSEKDISLEQARKTVDEICDYTVDLYKRGLPKEILTVGNHSDGVYVYQKMKRSGLERADLVYDLLKTNGGNNSGIKIAAVDETGGVHPDQFWQHYTLGNVTDRKFGDIWADTSEPLLGKLRNRKALLKGKCSRCSYVDLCNGNLRVRAEAVYDDLWAEDPACYLREEEIAS